MRTLKLTLAAFLLLFVAACSAGGDGASTELSDEAKPYAEALSTTMADPDALSEFHTIGLSDAEAEAMFDSFGTCDIDVRQLILDGLTTTSGSDAADAADGGLLAALASCSPGLGG